RAAEQGNADAQVNLGLMYANGQGVRQDDAQAVQWYRQAAEQGDAQAQGLLGIAYGSGYGVRQDSALAQEWYGKACDNGDQDGCNNYRRLKLGY
ncbi:TPA: tetratricopeptide repeat protein, partial [Neisseria subflava]